MPTVVILNPWEVASEKQEIAEKALTFCEDILFEGERVAILDWFVHSSEWSGRGGKDVEFINSDDEKLCGYFIPPDRVCIYANLSLAETAKTVAHEFFHLWQFKKGHPFDRAEREKRAAQFEASFAKSPFFNSCLSAPGGRVFPVADFYLGGGASARAMQRCSVVPLECVPYPVREGVGIAVRKAASRTGADWILDYVLVGYCVADKRGDILLPLGRTGHVRCEGGRARLMLRADAPEWQITEAARQAVYEIARQIL